MCNTEGLCDSCKYYDRLYKKVSCKPVDKLIETAIGYCKLNDDYERVVTFDDSCKDYKKLEEEK